MQQQNVTSLVAHGLQFHQRGDLTSAEQIYSTILAREPGNADALHLLGSLRGRQGLGSEGIRLMEQAIAVSPRVSIYHNNLGNLKAEVGDKAGAEHSYRCAIKLDRRNADAHLNLAKLLNSLCRLKEARECVVASLRLASRSVVAHMLLGLLEETQGKPRAALQSYLNAVRLDPKYAPGHLAIANIYAEEGALDRAEENLRIAIAIDPHYSEALYNLALNLQLQGKLSDAVQFYRTAIAISPRCDAELYNNYGSALTDLEQHAEAESAFRRAIELKPEFDEAYFNLGRVLTTYGDASTGIEMLRKAIEINPRNAPAYLQLGTALHAYGFLDDAIDANRKSLELDPSCQSVRRNLGMVLAAAGDIEGLDILETMTQELPESSDLHWTWAVSLLLHSRYEEGWREYEWRMHVEEMQAQHRKFDVPRWTGQPLSGQRVLLYTEQGFGDTLQFARYAMLAAARGAAVVLEVQPSLKRWCAALPGVADCVAQGDTSAEFELFAPLMSLPYVLGTGATIPLPFAPRFEDGPRGDTQGKTTLKVGIVWAGNPKHVLDRLRSTRLLEWGGLAKIAGVEFTSLQVGDSAMQIDTGDHGFNFVADCRTVRDFADTAAVVAGLDLVITVDTAVAHLAGSMGKPVWILLYNVVDWRWGLGTDRTPWYPSARLFRQRSPGDWSAVFAELETSLRDLAVGRPLPELTASSA